MSRQTEMRQKYQKPTPKKEGQEIEKCETEILERGEFERGGTKERLE